MRIHRLVSVLSATALAATAVLVPVTAATADRPGADLPTAHDQAHAHNDYEHDRPLYDALAHGFTSVEADVWLVDGELLVAHDAEDLDPERTFASLYLEPLRDLVRGRGRSVFPHWDGTFQLLIDIKSEGESTYAAIESELAQYRPVFAQYVRGRVLDGPVQAVISGNRPLATMADADRRYGFYDGRSGDLDSGIPAALMPLVSDNWANLFTWSGTGEMPADEREQLHAYVAAAHAAGYRVRFWNTLDVAGPARDAIWTELLDAGVDHLNTDDLAGLDQFLTAGGR
ncbi:hypothetical protein EXU48_15025 [Occultella glacieicola]|uniref:Altered inheritance of mitochondria protein 6 n=1 Tax=Occultella glacieicola TaxID=2518684 RepID=A0ABY2E1L5_9MICO|nr:phosphatidylinositol-specific phospholipase C/glycerophosphodiester phosphodiesterase family protein [Occultella glacieicola]TDE91470.1 hypothetical protein EXU48_15025 [Occultella glacieicola]